MADAEDSYEYAHGIEVRYLDIDTQHVVNNGVFADYLTEARVGYFEEVADLVAEEVQDLVVAHLEIDYLRPIERGNDDVTVRVRCGEVSRSSFRLEYELSDGGTPVARAHTVHVTVDPSTGESKSVPGSLRECLESRSADGEM